MVQKSLGLSRALGYQRKCGAQHIRYCRPRICAQQWCGNAGNVQGCEVDQWGNTAGAIQSVTLSGCNSGRVVGYIRVPVYSAPEASITLSLRNGTVASPCGGVYGAGQASRVVQIRQVPPWCALHRTGLLTQVTADRRRPQVPDSLLLSPALL